MIITCIPYLFYIYRYKLNNDYLESEYKDSLDKLIHNSLLQTTKSKLKNFNLDIEGNIKVNYFISENSLSILHNIFKSLQEEKISYNDYLDEINTTLYRNLSILYIATPYEIYCYTTFKDYLLENLFKPGIPYEEQFESVLTELSFYYNIQPIKLFYQFTQFKEVGNFKCTYSIKLESF